MYPLLPPQIKVAKKAWIGDTDLISSRDLSSFHILELFHGVSLHFYTPDELSGPDLIFSHLLRAKDWGAPALPAAPVGSLNWHCGCRCSCCVSINHTWPLEEFLAGQISLPLVRPFVGGKCGVRLDHLHLYSSITNVPQLLSDFTATQKSLST